MNKYLEKLAELKDPGQPEHLGIDLSKGDDKELYKWLIAVTLFSRPIQRTVAARASKQLTSEGIDSPDAVQNTGYPGLVQALGRGHYVRYDFSMSDTLLAQAEYLKSKYGTISNLVHGRTPEQIRQEIQTVKGIGPLGSQLFVDGLGKNVKKYRNHMDVSLVPLDEHSKRLRDILVNSSRVGTFNPYVKDRYDYNDTKEEFDDQGKLIKLHLKDRNTGSYAELYHPDIARYRLRDFST